MQIKTVQYQEATGWSDEIPSGLDSDQTLVLVFGASSFKQQSELLKLIEQFPNSTITGCSTGGEIMGANVFDNSLAVAVVRFAETELRQETVFVSDYKNSFNVGETLAAKLIRDDLRGIFVLSDGLTIDGSELLNGMNSQTSSSIPITGGLAADLQISEKTWVLGRDGIKSNCVSAIGFYGDSVKIGHGSRDGLDILGIEQRITKSEGNQLFEVDGKPALDLYKKYLGEKASDLPNAAINFPISIRSDLKSEKRVIRSVMKVNEELQSMTFAGEVPEGTMFRLMLANPDRVIDGAAEASMMTEQYGSNDENVLSIAISCVGRRWMLGSRSAEELEASLEGMPEGTVQIGFYSYGEICPYSVGVSELQNQTMTLTTISEEVV